MAYLRCVKNSEKKLEFLDNMDDPYGGGCLCYLDDLMMAHLDLLAVECQHSAECRHSEGCSF